MRDRLDTALSIITAAAAVTIAAALVHRNFGGRGGGQVAAAPPVYDPNWRQLLSAAKLVAGDTAAPVQIVEFGDFECPFCRQFQKAFRGASNQYSHQLALWFIHFPLDIHRFAVPAALAAECAGSQGQFERMSDVLYDKQDSLGLKTWVSYAVDSHVPDTVSFIRCVHDTIGMPDIRAGLAVGAKVHVDATPTILINGWRFSRPPTDSLSSVVARTLAGETPGSPPEE